MSKSNLSKHFSVFGILIFFCINQRSTANEQCLLRVPKKGFALLEGNFRVTNQDVEDGPWFVHHAKFINYGCYKKYKLEGNEQIQCVDGQLTPPAPKCMQISCDDPPKIENAHYKKSELVKPYNEETFLEPICNEGYRKTNHSKKKIKCMRKGPELVWSRRPICEVSPYCNDTGVPLNGTRHGTSFYAGDEVRFFCDRGFRMIGMNEIKCLEDATWSSPAPICKEIPNCGDPGTPVSGMRFGDSFLEGDEVSFACGIDEDQLIGDRTIKCGSDGRWSSARPRCKPPSACPDPPQHDHVVYTSQHRRRDYYIPGDSVVVSCQEGYKLNGPYDTYHCSDEVPQKTELPLLESDYYDNMYEYRFEVSEIEVPFWKENFLQCEEITCDPPKTPRKGFIHELTERVEQSFQFGFTLNYGCLEGYQIVGPHFSRCEEVGWFPSNTAVRCKKIICPAVNNLENGYYIYTEDGRNIGGVVEYGCSPGFKLFGSKQRECLENGQWSGDLPKCVGNTFCPDPGTPLRGYKYGNNYSKGAIVEFKCDSESTLVGSKTRECLENGTWSGTDVFCQKYTDFDRPLELQFRLLTQLDSSTLLADSTMEEKYNNVATDKRQLPDAKKGKAFGRMIDTSYKQGHLVLYFIFDSSASVGEKHFNLSVDFVKALVKRVKVTADGVRVGGAAFAKKIVIDHGFLPMDFETTDKVVDALELLKSNKFKGGGTNINGALEYFQEAIYPLIRKRLRSPKTHIFLLTDGNYNTGGDPTDIATAMKTKGIEFSCIGLSGNKETNKKLINEIASNSSNVYYLKDNANLGWLLDNVLTNKTDYSRCGIAEKREVEKIGVNNGRIYGGKITKTYWPWMAMLRGRDSQSKKIEGFCGGTLIDRKWILTAAHCMYYPGSGKRKRGDREIEVRLGYTKNHNHTCTQQISSWKIFMPQAEFNFNNFDYDVALILLEKEADYKLQIRPVCLSPAEKDIKDNHKLYAEKSGGWAIGYGNFEDQKDDDEAVKFRDLREVPLDIGPNDECRNGLDESPYKYTNRMFCAGGKKGNDTCQGDSGGPFMKHQYNADGDIYWTQTGIVSFSPKKKCGLDGVYGYYTKVSAVREWIDHTIRTN